MATPRRRVARYAASSLVASALLLSGFAGTSLGANPSSRTAAPAAKRDALGRLVAAHTVHVSFEKSARGWYGFGTGTHIEPIRGTARAGVGSLKTRVTRRTRAGGAAYDAGGRGVAVLPATRYEFVAWVKGTGRLHLTVGLHARGGHALRTPRLSGSGSAFVPRRKRWHRYGIRFTTPPNASSAVLKVGGLGRKTATYFIDSVTLRPTAVGPSAGSPAPPSSPAKPAGTTGQAPTPATAPTTPSPSYDSAIAYTQTRPAFTPLREVDVASQSELQAAVANIQAGDLVKATTGFTVDGEFQISVNPSGPAVIDLGTGAGAVQFSYTGPLDLPSIWIVNASNLRIYGGDIHGAPPGQTGGGEVTFYHATNILWWGFHIHDVPGTALNLAPVYGPISGCDLQGEIDHWGENPAGDPHAEKGTGVHAANVGDITGGVYTNNRLALFAHDGPTGAAIQVGNPDGTGQISGNTMILKATNLTKIATSQVAGNALQEWGGVPMQITVPYLEASNLTGRAVDTNGVYPGVSQAGVVVAYGRAANTNLNPYLGQTESAVSPTASWDTRHSSTYADVQ